MLYLFTYGSQLREYKQQPFSQLLALHSIFLDVLAYAVLLSTSLILSFLLQWTCASMPRKVK